MNRPPLLALCLLLACGDPATTPAPDEPDLPPDLASDLPALADMPPDLAPELPLVAEPGERESGGALTIADSGARALMQPAPGLPAVDQTAFLTGQTVFEVDWLAAPHPQDVRDGLGPLYHASACAGCHFQNGRGAPSPADGPVPPALLMRLGVPDGAGGWAPDPVYGGQLQPRAIPGHAPEALVRVAWSLAPMDGGEPLLWPTYTIERLGYGPHAEGLVLGPRMAQALIGLGLLEAVPEQAIRALADPDDLDGDGVSGRVNSVDGRLGRFGWKANQHSLLTQNAAALLGDMGLTSPLHPAPPCSAAQTACAEAATGGEPEIDAARLDALTRYTRLLAVPARRDHDAPDVLAGKRLFHEAGCAACHVPSLRTGLADDPALADQRIWPYTDMLLHDMGEGLADGLPDHDASGSEWRTPPLWGIGLTATVSGHSRFLHDGRARSLWEAIRWHDGEARGARRAAEALTAEQRALLLRFLESL
jgi:CxxC motif-containing protein (DUF1111 family)